MKEEERIKNIRFIIFNKTSDPHCTDEELAKAINDNLKIDKSEVLEIVSKFQEGFNTNKHCMELARAISESDNIIAIISKLGGGE